MAKQLTPMRQQYLKLKEENQDCLLFFRLGDFYEMFDDDARLASRELDLTLTTRDRDKSIPEEDRVPMCGVPYHSAEGYIARLIDKGYRVAICEQTEDPALAKGLVSRDVIRIITPGTATAPSMLDEGRNNFLCSIYQDSTGAGIAFCDLSTGETSATAFPGGDCLPHLVNELGRFQPTECILSDTAAAQPELCQLLKERLRCTWQRLGEMAFRPEIALPLCRQQFRVLPDLPPQGELALQAVGGLLRYLHDTQKGDLSHISTLTWYTGDQYMELDLTTRRNLELTETLRSKEKRGSLLWVLDKTRTPMGRRLLRSWLEKPLLSPAQIRRRLTAVEELTADLVLREELTLLLREITDLERLISRIVYGTANARDLRGLANGLGQIPRLQALLSPCKSPLLQELLGRMEGLEPLCHAIHSAIVDDPPFSVREGGLLRDGYHAEVDQLRNIRTNGKDMVARLEATEKEKTGIRGLRIKYNKVFGYYIEVGRNQINLVPDSYVRKQTTANAERYINQELKEMEHTILSAQDRVTALEYQLFTVLRQTAADAVDQIQRTAAAIAGVDVLTSLATVAVDNHYCKPEVDSSGVLEITDGRHPVVERMLKDTMFVPNDTTMDGRSSTLAIITGPNMAGKSTYMRQVAQICLMAQIGSFVPARAARLGVVDRVFTRIGASDDLASGQSTFMVEMSEVAQILKHATAHSLILLDEIGRGTSTYDGMSIARAVLEYCANPRQLGAKTLFATHYHELTVLEGQLPGVRNYHIAAKKKADDIIFLRKIVQGGADRSYGVEVARLAGVPATVLHRAKAILKELEAGAVQTAPTPAPQRDDQLSFGDMAAAEVAEILRRTDLNTLTPIEAMNLVYQLKQKL